MENTIFENRSSVDEELHISAQGLRGKQSVRATFRLPEHIIQLLGIVARQLGLKQKSLFDHLIEDIDVLSKVASGIQGSTPQSSTRRQKTFVLSKRSLEVLDNVARRQNIPRDILVEISIQRLLPVMNAEQEKHRKRIQVYQEMEICRDHCEKLLDKVERLLGNEDQAALLLRRVADVCDESIQELAGIIDKGQAMEEYG